MSDLPTGTITFLFTDIEGSTGLWQQHRDAMPAALARHHAILRNAIESHHGYVFQIIGDAFCAAFFTPSDALAATIDAQRALRAETWDTTGSLRVRMGLHTGVAEVHLDDVKAGQYASGLTLSRAQRIMSAGYGGQVLVSSTTSELLRGLLPDGVTLRDLSEHRLKGLLNPEYFWQVVAPDLPHEFPPLQSLNAIPNNLPIQLTSFIGREKEIAQVKQLLTGTSGVVPPRRLVTLTGSGGVGKTRLAIQVGHEVLPFCPHGVWLVELSPLTNPDLVPGAVATVLGVHDTPDRPLLTALTDYVREKTLLLVLDNCEHVIDACAQLGEHLLQQCPGLRILASSREALGVDGEAALRVHSLSLPAAEHVRRETMEQSEAVRLFVERAAAALPSFYLTDANAPAIAQICRRLDGIALAIELAAARVKLLQVEQIAARLDDAFRLLTGGSRTALPRQQTLRATIDWSHNLMSEAERRVFRQFAVFAGGWTLEAAEAVCASDGVDAYDVLDLLTQLANKSLLIVEREQNQAARYALLETTRQYAREKLAESGEGEAVRGRHLDYYLELAERLEQQLRTSERSSRWKPAMAELDNVRAALEWSLAEARTTEIEKGVRLASALGDMWEENARTTREGTGWLQQGLTLLAMDGRPENALVRAKGLTVAGRLAYLQGMGKTGRAMLEESVALYRAANLTDKRDLVLALTQLALAWLDADLQIARTLTDESVAIGRELGPSGRWHLALALYLDGWVANRQGDYEAARSRCQEGLALFRQVGDRWMIAATIQLLGQVAVRQGDPVAARSLYQDALREYQFTGYKYGAIDVAYNVASLDYATGDYESARVRFEEILAYCRDTGDKLYASISLRGLGMTLLRLGDNGQAAHLLRESLLQSQEIQTDRHPSMGLAAWAEVWRGREKWGRAAVLLGAVESQANRPGYWQPSSRADYDQTLAATRAALGEEVFAAAMVEGRAMTIKQAIAYALEETTK